MDLEVGAPIGTKYRIVRKLGEGGMGLVFEARHEALGTHVAIKVLRDEVMKDKESVARFGREARAAAVLRSSNAARILDVGEMEGGRPFIVMELLEGNDLELELERRGPLPVMEVVGYVTQACDAIAEAHSLGIVHRDLKPANIFLVSMGQVRVAKVLDFGISRYDGTGESRVTQTQSAFGTPLYMSPEALKSAKLTDARSDVWAFGVILYELLTGLPPFIADTPTGVAVAVTVETPIPIREGRPDVPDDLVAIIAKALDKNPNGRFANASELRDALQAFLGGDSTSTVRIEPLERSSVEGARAQSQRQLATTQTGEPITSVARPESASGRIAIVAAVALVACAAVVSGVLLLKSTSADADPSAMPVVEAAAAPVPLEPEASVRPTEVEVQPTESGLAVAPPTSASSLSSGAPEASASSSSTVAPSRSTAVPSVANARSSPTAAGRATSVPAAGPAAGPTGGPPAPTVKQIGGSPSRL